MYACTTCLWYRELPASVCVCVCVYVYVCVHYLLVVQRTASLCVCMCVCVYVCVHYLLVLQRTASLCVCVCDSMLKLMHIQTLVAVYIEHQYSVNASMTLATFLSLNTMESLQNGYATVKCEQSLNTQLGNPRVHCRRCCFRVLSNI